VDGWLSGRVGAKVVQCGVASRSVLSIVVLYSFVAAYEVKGCKSLCSIERPYE
jgi:hypothetical protein